MRSSFRALGLAVVTMLASAAQAAETSESLQAQATTLAKSCRDPSETWALPELTRNFQPCNGAMLAFVKVIELSKKDEKTIKAISPALTVVDVKLVKTALFLGRLHGKRRDRASALRYLRVACSGAISSYTDGNLDPNSWLMAGGTEAEERLGSYKESCVPAPEPK